VENEYITPQDAVSRLMKMHYPGKKRGDAQRVRMALIGALRSGQIEWRCEKWREVFFGESGARFDANGGEILVEPKHGWPSDFWQPALAANNDYWRGNAFISYGAVTMLTAPYKVRLWLGANSEGMADWSRYADGVALNWGDARELLSGPAWRVWCAEAHQPKSPPARSSHYVDALIRLIAVAVNDPDAIRNRLFDSLHDAFDTGNKDCKIPDEAELKRIAARIRSALQPIEPPPA
jgi:hypothetical protein